MDKHRKICKYVTDNGLSIEIAKDFLDSILENSRDIIYRYSLKTETCDFISASIEALTGYTPQEVYDQGVNILLENLHPDDKPMFTKLYSGLQNSTISDTTVRFEYRFRHKNGRYVWHNHVIGIIRDETGQIQATIGTVRDITAQKKHEQELKSSQDRFKQLSEATFEGICIHDQGQIIDGNQQFLEMLGVDSIDEIKGLECFKFIEPEYHELVKKYISTGEKGPYELLGRKVDGTVFPVQVRARECMWEGKQVRIATFRDLTEQKQLEQQLKISLNRFKLLFENAPDAIFLADAETGIIADANCKAAELLGIPISQIVGMHQSKLHPPEEAEKYRKIFEKHAQNQFSIINEDVYIQHKTGRKTPVQINASIMQFDDQKFICGIFRDITEQKKLLEHIAASETHFKRLSEAAFEAIAIHEGGNIIDVNQQYIDMFGYTLEEIRATPGIQMIAPQSRGLVKEKMDAKYEGVYEAFGMKKDGTIFPVEIQARESIIDGKPIRIGAIRDMTEQMQQVEQLKAVFESSQDCIIVFDEDYNHLYMNQTAKDFAERITGHPATGNMLDSMPYTPEFLSTWKDRIAHVFKTGQIQKFDDAFSIAGQTIYSEATLSPLRYPGGGLFAVSLVFRNITDLKASQLRYKRLAEAAFEGIVLHNREHFIEANQQFLDMFGYTLAELQETVNGDDLIAPESLKKAKKLIESECEDPYEVTCQRKDGSLFPAEFHAREIIIDGVPCRIVAVRDLTVQKHLIRDLAESEAKFKELYLNAKAALYRARIKDGKLLACSLATAKMHGYNTVEECLEKHHGTAHFVDKDRRNQLLDKLLKNKRVEDFQYQIKRADNKTAWLSLTAEIFPEKGWIEGVVKDITASKILTTTEMNILKFILSGKSNKEIAYGLGRSIRTIEDHRAHIMNKLGADNIVELTRIALEYGIKPDGE